MLLAQPTNAGPWRNQGAPAPKELIFCVFFVFDSKFFPFRITTPFSKFFNVTNSNLNVSKITWNSMENPNILTIHQLDLRFTTKYFSSCCFNNPQLLRSKIPKLLSLLAPMCLFALINIKNQKSKFKNRNMRYSCHVRKNSQNISYSTTEKSKSVRNSQKTQHLLQTHAIFTLHNL